MLISVQSTVIRSLSAIFATSGWTLTTIDPLEHDAPRFERCHPDRDHRGFPGGHIGEDQGTFGAPAIDAVELVRREVQDRIQAVDDRITEDRLVHRPADRGATDCVGKQSERDGIGIIMHVVDDILVKVAVQHLCKFLNVFAAVRLVDREDRVDDFSDNSSSGALSPPTLIVADDRG